MNASKIIQRLLVLSIVTLATLAFGFRHSVPALAVDDFLSDQSTPTIYLFYSQTCPYCEKEIDYLKQITKEPGLVKVAMFEVSTNQAHQTLFHQTMAALDHPMGGVPTLIVGQEVIVGYDDKSNQTQTKIDQAISKLKANTEASAEVRQLITNTNQLDPLLMEKGEIINQAKSENDQQIAGTTTKAVKDQSVGLIISILGLAVVVGLVIFRNNRHLKIDPKPKGGLER